ncbi:anthrax toxin-like adenylyl cyclase domain-containing protein [Candidatus Tisiphia endosymbiont of Nemotelus uliginosus]|uniref:anthrax toxin-like adenylyl cyclase domain-containing protein n=1 Tax=Candidatus Tisiphia endosymbiont of Nemotelus uliginosus TaxID=3077926 RepID=UPI0035C8B2D4
MATNTNQYASNSSFTYQALTIDEIKLMDSNRDEEERKTNIQKIKLQLLKNEASVNEMEIIIRPVNPGSFNHFQKGKVVGKNIFVHNKSADSGPVSGLIPVNVSLSKIGTTRDFDKIKEFQEYNNHSLENSNKEFKHLEQQFIKARQSIVNSGVTNITEEDLWTKANIDISVLEPLISVVNIVDKNNNQIYIFTGKDGISARDPKYLANTIYAIKDANGKFQRIDDNHNSLGEYIPAADTKPEAVQVIGKPEIGINTENGTIKIKSVKPIAADIDILAYGTKLNLKHEKIENYTTIVAGTKEPAVNHSTLQHILPHIKAELIQKPTNQIFTEYMGEEIDREYYKKQINPKMGELLDNLAHIERQKEYLKGMGEGPSAVLAITGVMRDIFPKAEISHSSEQFNYFFTQPLDTEWIHITSAGHVNIIKGEQELIQTFNQVEAQGMCMPPNPNWGWQLNDKGQYEIDRQLKSRNEDIEILRKRARSDNSKQVNSITDISEKNLQLNKLKLGQGTLDTISTKSEKIIAEQTKELETLLRVYENKYTAKSQVVHSNNLAPRHLSPVSPDYQRLSNNSLLQKIRAQAVDIIKPIMQKGLFQNNSKYNNEIPMHKPHTLELSKE